MCVNCKGGDNRDVSNRDVSNRDVINRDVNNRDISNRDVNNRDVSNRDVNNRDVSRMYSVNTKAPLLLELSLKTRSGKSNRVVSLPF